LGRKIDFKTAPKLATLTVGSPRDLKLQPYHLFSENKYDIRFRHLLMLGGMQPKTLFCSLTGCSFNC